MIGRPARANVCKTLTLWLCRVSAQLLHLCSRKWSHEILRDFEQDSTGSTHCSSTKSLELCASGSQSDRGLLDVGLAAMVLEAQLAFGCQDGRPADVEDLEAVEALNLLEACQVC